MKTFALVVLLGFALESFGASPRLTSVKTRGVDLCPSAVAIDTTTISINGHDIQKATFECPDVDLSTRVIAPSLAERAPIDVPSGLLELSRRNANECTTTGTECQCGQPSSCACVNTTPDAPTGNDCSILIDALKVIPQLEGSTFIVQPRTFQLLQFQSCAIEWSNLGQGIRPGPLEYCWDEVVALTGLSNQDCLESGVSSGASCTPSDGLWNLRMFRISS